MIRALYPALKRNENGASLLEFALLFPAIMGIFLGGFDYAYAYYGRSVLIGAVHEAARRSTLESNNASQADVDAEVLRRVRGINPSATIQFDRKSYQNFASIRQPEVFVDADGNGVCDKGDQFDDLNRNGVWDPDPFSSGQGGGSDVVIYTARMTYPTLFGAWAFLNRQKDQQMVARTVIRNQPFSEQVESIRGTCP